MRMRASCRSIWTRCATAPGVIAVLTAADIPGENNCGPVLHDDPILADGEVQYLGQPVFAVIAETSRSGAPRRRAREKRRRGALRTARSRAHAARSEGAQAVRAAAAASAARRPGREDRGGAASASQATFEVGGQEQFYLEGQIAYAVPKEHGRHARLQLDAASERDAAGRRAHARLAAHNVVCECRRMGGGFGGKESQSALFACVAALAAQLLRRPVKLRADRDDDFMITGKRHDAVYEYEAGFDDDGRIARRARRNRVARGLFGGSVGRGRDARRLPLRQRVLPVRRRYRRAVLQDQHAVEHRVSRLRRSARRARDGSDARRASRIG